MKKSYAHSPTLVVALVVIAVLIASGSASGDVPGATSTSSSEDRFSTTSATGSGEDAGADHSGSATNGSAVPHTPAEGDGDAVEYAQGGSDYLKFVAFKAHIKSKAHLEDAHHGTSSYLKGRSWSSARLHFTVEADDPEDKVKLVLQNQIEIEAEWLGDGGHERTVNNLAWAKDMNGQKRTFSLPLAYNPGSSSSRSTTTTTGSSSRVRIGTRTEAEAATSHSDSVTSVTTTQFGGGPWAGHEIHSWYPTWEHTQTGKIETVKDIKSHVKQYLSARGTIYTTASIDIPKFNVSNDIFANHAIEVDDGVGDPTMVWDDPGSPTPPGDSCNPDPFRGRKAWMIASTIGLDGESGAANGVLAMMREDAWPAAANFEIATVPAGMTNLPTTLTLAEGTGFETFRFDGVVSGAYDITATLLDEYGDPTSTVLVVSTRNDSLEDEAGPDVYAEMVPDLLVPNEYQTYEGLAGVGAARVRVRRSAFAEFETASSVFQLTVADPSGILESLPTTVTIPAGDLVASTEISLKPAVSGEATITVSHDGDDLEMFTVRAIDQSLSFDMDELYLPLNGRLLVRVALAVAENVDRALSVTEGDPSIATAESNDVEGNLIPAGMECDLLWVEAQAETGASTITISHSAGVSAGIAVHVRPPEVELTRTAVVLSGMGSAEEGVITIQTPEGITFDSFDGPAQSSTYMTVTGVGTGTITITMLAGGGYPATVSCTCSLDGDDTSEPFDVAVNDGTRPGIPKQGYFVSVP